MKGGEQQEPELSNPPGPEIQFDRKEQYMHKIIVNNDKRS
jgi:hypothetical protein